MERVSTRQTFDNERFVAPLAISESLLLLAGAKKLRPGLSVGLGAKVARQDLAIPDTAEQISEVEDMELRKTKRYPGAKSKVFYSTLFDVSATARLSESISLGAVVMNLGDDLVGKTGEEDQGFDALGVGLAYTAPRFELGSELLYREDHTDLSIGASFVAHPRLTIRGGLSQMHDTKTVGVDLQVPGLYRIEDFLVGYTFNDNEAFPSPLHLLSIDVAFRR